MHSPFSIEDEEDSAIIADAKDFATVPLSYQNNQSNSRWWSSRLIRKIFFSRTENLRRPPVASHSCPGRKGYRHHHSQHATRFLFFFVGYMWKTFLFMSNIVSFHILYEYFSLQANEKQNLNRSSSSQNHNHDNDIKSLHRGNDPSHSRKGMSSSVHDTEYDSVGFYSIPSVWQFFVVTSCVWILIVLYQTIFQSIKHVRKSIAQFVSKVFTKNNKRKYAHSSMALQSFPLFCRRRSSDADNSQMSDDVPSVEESEHLESDQLTSCCEGHENNQRPPRDARKNSNFESTLHYTITETSVFSEENNKSLPSLIQKHGILLLPLSSWFHKEAFHMSVIQKGYLNECLIHKGIAGRSGETTTDFIEEDSSIPMGSPAPFANEVNLVSSIPNIPIIVLDPWKIAYAIYGWGISFFLVSFCIHGLSSICLLVVCLLWNAIPSLAYYDKKRVQWERQFFFSYSSFVPLPKLAAVVSWISFLFIILILYDPLSHIISWVPSNAKDAVVAANQTQQNNSTGRSNEFICPWYYPCVIFKANYSGALHFSSSEQFLNDASSGYLWYYLLIYIMVGGFVFFKGTQEAIGIHLDGKKLLSLYIPSVGLIGSLVLGLFAIFLELSNAVLDAHRHQRAEFRTSVQYSSPSRIIDVNSMQSMHFLFIFLIACPFSLYYSMRVILETFVSSSPLRLKTLSSCIVFSYLFIYSVHIQPRQVNQLNPFFTAPNGKWEIVALCVASFAFGLHLFVEVLAAHHYSQYFSRICQSSYHNNCVDLYDVGLK